MAKPLSKFHAALVPLFLGALWLPMLCSVLHFDPIPRPNENRKPAEFPAWPNSAATLQKFPAAFEAYYNDHFGGRNSLVYCYLWAKSVVLRVSPEPLTVLGKEDWTYLGHDQQIAASRGTHLFTEAQLEEQRKVLTARRDIAAKYGAKFLAMIGPDKSTIYPEYAPDWLHRVSEASNYSQLAGYMKQHSDVPFLDLRPALLDAKSSGLVYLRSNSHWNSVGAYAAYHALAEQLVKWLPSFKPVQPGDLDFETLPRGPNDLEAEIDIDYFKAAPIEGAHLKTTHFKRTADKLDGLNVTGPVDLSVIENENKQLPRLVIFNDSFGWALMPFLGESFSRAVFVRTPVFSEEIIAAEKPDLVIFLRVERSLTPVKSNQ